MKTETRPSRRALLRWAGLGAAVLAPTAFYAAALEPSWFDVSRVDIPIPKLPEPFDGVTIAQLSDLHHSATTSLDHIQKAVDLTRSLDPDIVALTGDYVSWRNSERLPPLLDVLGQLRPRLGGFAVLGNHDSLATGPMMNKALGADSVRALDDEIAVVRKDGAQINIIGINRFAAFHERIGAGLDPEQTYIGLSHNPDVVDVLKIRPVSLALTGHTHGGQVRLPLIGAPALPHRHKELVAGLYSIGKLKLYVNRGIGCLTLRVRLNAPPEITLLTLRRANHA